MTGVEILNSQTVCDTLLPEWGIQISLMLTFVFLLVSFILAVNDKFVMAIICGLLCIVFAVLASVGGMSVIKSVPYIEYKVTIDDSVSINEFLEKYEIIDQDGKIYTVREKTQ